MHSECTEEINVQSPKWDRKAQTCDKAYELFSVTINTARGASCLTSFLAGAVEKEITSPTDFDVKFAIKLRLCLSFRWLGDTLLTQNLLCVCFVLCMGPGVSVVVRYMYKHVCINRDVLHGEGTDPADPSSRRFLSWWLMEKHSCLQQNWCLSQNSSPKH